MVKLLNQKFKTRFSRKNRFEKNENYAIFTKNFSCKKSITLKI